MGTLTPSAKTNGSTSTGLNSTARHKTDTAKYCLSADKALGFLRTSTSPAVRDFEHRATTPAEHAQEINTETMPSPTQMHDASSDTAVLGIPSFTVAQIHRAASTFSWIFITKGCAANWFTTGDVLVLPVSDKVYLSLTHMTSIRWACVCT